MQVLSEILNRIKSEANVIADIMLSAENNDPPFCLILVGPSCSGKTFFRKALLQKLWDHNGDAWVLSTDDFIENVAAQNGVSYSEQFLASIGEADKRLSAYTECVKTHGEVSVIVDRTNMSSKSRSRWFRTFKDYTFIVVDMMPTVEDHEIMLSARPHKTLPPHVIAQHRSKYDNVYPPNAMVVTIHT